MSFAALSIQRMWCKSTVHPGDHTRKMTVTEAYREPMPADPSNIESHGKLHLLVADEDAATRGALIEIGSRLGFAVHEAPTAEEAREQLRAHSADVVLLGLRQPEDRLDLVEEASALDPNLSVIVMAAQASVPSAVESMRIGAADYIPKPFSMEEMADVLERVRVEAGERRHLEGASRRLREHLRSPRGLGSIIGASPRMEKLFRILAKVAQSSHPVLIQGESGTGKEKIARAIHSNGPRSTCPFVLVDCASLAPEMMEAEIFGYAKDAFPGALRDSAGLLAAADGGTVLFDEVSGLALEAQAKLLRAIEEKQIHPVGSNRRIPINVRILASTKKDLAELAASGHFRKDLYYRLNVVNLSIPPLRERPDDIPLLADHILGRLSRESGVAHSISSEMMLAMMEYNWPDNVRELENMLERAAAYSSAPVFEFGDLPTQLQNYHLALRAHPPKQAAGAEADSVVPLAEMEKKAILDSLRTLKGDKIKAARMLGIGKTTLYRKLKEYGIAETPAGSD